MKSFRYLMSAALIFILLGVSGLSAQPTVPAAPIPLCTGFPANVGFCIGHPTQGNPLPLQQQPVLPDCSALPANVGFCIGHPAVQPLRVTISPPICSYLLSNNGFCIGS